jgi:hypothetical protein
LKLPNTRDVLRAPTVISDTHGIDIGFGGADARSCCATIMRRSTYRAVTIARFR